MGFFEQLFGTELALPARAVVALILVLALIALTVWLVRRFGDTRVVRNAAGRGRQQRLAVLDAAVVDARRKLVLIRRDNVEHLLLLGGPTDVVVEPNIVRGAPVPAPARLRPVYDLTEPEPETPLVPQPEFGESERAPAPRPYYEPPSRAAPEPQRPAYEPPSRAASEPQRAAYDSPRAPRPAARSDAQYSEMAKRLEAALRKPAPEPEAGQRAPAPAPRPEPRTYTPPPRPEPKAPPRAPEQRAPAPNPSAPSSAADVFESLEEEMASLLRPPGKKEP